MANVYKVWIKASIHKHHRPVHTCTVIIQWIRKNHERFMTKPKNCRFGFFGRNINKVMLENRIQLRAKAAKLFRRSLVFFKKKCNQQGWKRETDSCIHVVSICEVHTYACTIVWCSRWFVPNQDNSPFFLGVPTKKLQWLYRRQNVVTFLRTYIRFW